MASEQAVNDLILRQHVRELLRDSSLPRENPAQMWAGAGCGALCDICGRAILHVDAEYELVFGRPVDATRRLHLTCYELWELERHQA